VDVLDGRVAEVPIVLVALALDIVFAVLLVVAALGYLRRVTRERTRRALVDSLVEAYTEPLSIAGVGEAAVAQGDAEVLLAPVAAVGYAPDWRPGPRPADATIPVRAVVSREHALSDPWLEPLADTVGPRPWVARVPILRGDEALGLLLLVAGRPRTLRDLPQLTMAAGIVAGALDHARLYQAAHDRARELEELNARRSEFMYAITHELRSPLTAIQAFAELLAADRGLLDGEGEQLLASLARGVDRLHSLVDELLALGRLEGSSLSVTVGVVDLRQPLRDAATLLRPAFLAREQELALELPERPVAVLGDASALERVLLNLLSNANRFSPRGSAVTARVRDVGGRARAEVHDAGPGVEADDRERIFEPFYRVQRPGAAVVPGSGLGLAVARRLVELQGGRIWVDPAPGGGSRFCIELPAAARVSAPVATGTAGEAPAAS
jgi:signal transduction histidine kinase